MAIEPQAPAGLKENPLMPAGPEPLVMEAFEGLNTASLRPGVPDKQCSWLDGFMPLAPRNLRTLPDVGSAIYTASALLIVLFGSFNIEEDSFLIAFLSDGSAVSINVNTAAVATILPAGSISSPSITTIGFCNYGSKYLLIVSSENPDGYWVWDGTTTYTAGTISPIIVLTDPGSGYQTVPTVQVTGGSGTGVVLTASINNGFVTDVQVANPGSGFLAGDTVTLTFSGGNSAGTAGNITATLTQNTGGSGAVLTGNFVSDGTFLSLISITVNNGGSGYSQFTTITTSGGNPVLTAVLTPTIVGGVITGVNILYGGAYLVSTPFSVNATDTGGYYVSSTTIVNGGSGYSPSTTITASGGGGPISQATFTPVITAGVITGVTIQNGGLYGSNTPPTLTVNDVAADATATAELMPFAISGSAVETYTGHVWVAKGATITFSAPGSFSDFGTANGGGTTESNDSFLQVKYVRLINTNGFLWLVGDSSLSYISGVTTGGSPTIVTTFTLQNADPEVGTSWPYSVSSFNRNIIFANSWGAHIGYGSAVQKISDMLDGVYDSVLTPNTAWQTSCAKATIYNRKVWMFLIPIINPITLVQQNKLFLWDGKRWWASSQSVALTFIQSQEINSVIRAWGTNGTSIYPLFTTPSTNFTKYAQSRLWDVGGYWLGNAVSRFWAMLKYYLTPTSTPLTVTIDNESYPTNSYSFTIADNNTGITVVNPQAVAQQGVLAGFTLSTNAADVAVLSAAIRPEIVQYRG